MAKKYQPFKFKQFEIAQDKCAMKVGTDGVLLGAWTLAEGRYILDIGTGTGLIALMLAQRNPHAVIDAIDIDQSAVEQAKENFSNSPWHANLNAIHTDLKNFSPFKKYDLIVTNPPYFVNSTPPPKEDRLNARHNRQLSFEDILGTAQKLLAENGKLSIILPYSEGQIFLEMAKEKNMFPEKITEFYSRLGKPVERLLILLSAKEKKIKYDKLIHYESGHQWSEDYKQLTKEYYVVI